jgi:simple sugar transport system permease protein
MLFVAIAMAIVFGCVMGYIYGKLMNAVKGSEMAIATYTGFAITYLFCVVWVSLPFKNENIGWFMGGGLRNFIALDSVGASGLFDNLWRFRLFATTRITNGVATQVGGIIVPTGAILLVLAACLLMWLFFRSKAGIAISAVGMNPMFARATGLNVDRSRVLANMVSTSLAAVGIIIYSQGFGFVQLYDGPLLMAFPAVAAVLVGGASASRSKVMHVIIGTLLFQGLMTNGPPVFSKMLGGADITEAVRMTIQNGIILYALTQMKGGGK